jgi:hypothetical protein
VRNVLVRVVRAWRALEAEQRHAAIAAFALLVTMLLPWYDKNVAVGNRFASDHLNAFGVFSWVEAAIFLVALGVMLLLFYRAEQRAFHLPGGDGTVIFGAGLWAAFLFLWRVFDRPSASGGATTVGIQWGFFFAFLAAGALAFAGYRIRATDRAEPTAAQDPTTKVEPTPLPVPVSPRAPSPPRRRRRPAGPDAPTQIAGQLSLDDGPDEPPDPYR